MSASSQTTAIRSKTMAAVRSTGTKPERRVAQLLREQKIRFEQQVRSLPGTPDFLLSDAQMVLFVHGCWWHGHTCRRGARVPKTNVEYWTAKVDRNRRRDRRVARLLRAQGYSVWVIWECELRRGLPGRVLSAIERRVGTGTSG